MACANMCSSTKQNYLLRFTSARICTRTTHNNTLPVKRNLFGTKISDEDRARFTEELDNAIPMKIMKWNFDFPKGKPLKSNGRYHWVLTHPDENLTESSSSRQAVVSPKGGAASMEAIVGVSPRALENVGISTITQEIEKANTVEANPKISRSLMNDRVGTSSKLQSNKLKRKFSVSDMDMEGRSARDNQSRITGYRRNSKPDPPRGSASRSPSGRCCW